MPKAQRYRQISPGQNHSKTQQAVSCPHAMPNGFLKRLNVCGFLSLMQTYAVWSSGVPKAISQSRLLIRCIACDHGSFVRLASCDQQCLPCQQAQIEILLQWICEDFAGSRRVLQNGMKPFIQSFEFRVVAAPFLRSRLWYFVQ